MLRIHLLIFLLTSVDAGSVWWEWYPSFGECIADSNKLHQEWTRDLECIASKNLKTSDPLRQQSLDSYGEMYDVTIHCFDDSGGTNFNADDDHVEIQYYNSTNGACSVPFNGTFILNNTICGKDDPSAPHALTHSRFHCSRCNYMFFDEVAPPYFIQGVGILVFLLVCILINYTLQDKFDRFMKTFPTRFGKHKPPHPVIGQLGIFKGREEDYLPKGDLLIGGDDDDDDDDDDSSNNSPHSVSLVPVSPELLPAGRGSRVSSSNYFNDSYDNIWANTYSVRGAGRGGLSSVSGFDDGSVLTRSSSNLTGMRVRSNTAHRSIIGPQQISLFKADGIDKQSPVLSPVSPARSGMTLSPSNILSPPSSSRRRSATQRGPRPLLNKTPRQQAPEVRFDYSEHSSEQVDNNPFENSNLIVRTWGSYVTNLIETMDTDEQQNHQKQFQHEGQFPEPLSDTSNDVVVDTYLEHGNVDQTGFISCSICKQQHCTGKADIRTTVLRGGLGGYFEIEKTNKDYAFCSFTYPAAWVRDSVFMYPPLHDVTDVPIEKEDVPPCITITDPIGENAWRHLLSDPKEYRISRSKTQDGVKFHSVKLKGVIAEWIPFRDIITLGPCGGSYVRTVPLKDFKEGSGPYWKEWWADFELCVGLMRRIELDANGSYNAAVKFQGSATLLIPIKALTRVSERDHNADFLVVPQRVTHRTMMAVFVASAPPLLAAKGCFLLLYFLYSVKNALSDGHGGRASHHSSWEAYEEVYFKLFNSGYPTLMADCGSVATYFTYVFRPTKKQFITGVGIPVLTMLSLSLGISLPGIVTHAIPMIGLYCVMWVPTLLFLGGLMYHVRKFEPPPPPVKPDQLYNMPYIKKNFKCYLFTSGLFHLFFRFIAELIAVVFVQTNYNFAVLVYDGNPVIRTISDEFKMRQVSCAWEQGLKMASYFI